MNRNTDPFSLSQSFQGSQLKRPKLEKMLLACIDNKVSRRFSQKLLACLVWWVVFTLPACGLGQQNSAESIHSANIQADRSLQEAEKLEAKGELQNARQLFAETAKRYGDDPAAHLSKLGVARTSGKLGEYDVMFDAANGLLEGSNGTLDPVLRGRAESFRGIALSKSGDDQKALRDLRQKLGTNTTAYLQIHVPQSAAESANRLGNPELAYYALSWVPERSWTPKPENLARTLLADMDAASIGRLFSDIRENHPAHQLLRERAAQVGASVRRKETPVAQTAADQDTQRGVNVVAWLPLSGRYRAIGQEQLRGLQAGSELSQHSKFIVEDVGKGDGLNRRANEAIATQRYGIWLVYDVENKLARYVEKAKSAGILVYRLDRPSEMPFGLNRSLNMNLEKLAAAAKSWKANGYVIIAPAGQAERLAFRQLEIQMGRPADMVINYPSSQTNFAKLFRDRLGDKAKSLRGKAVFVIDSPSKVEIIVPTLLATGMRTANIETSADSAKDRSLLCIPEYGFSFSFLSRSGTHFANALFTLPYDPLRDDHRLITYFRSAYGRRPTLLETQAADIFAIADALFKKGAQNVVQRKKQALSLFVSTAQNFKRFHEGTIVEPVRLFRVDETSHALKALGL